VVSAAFSDPSTGKLNSKPVASIARRRTASGDWRYDVRYRVGRRVVTRTFSRRVDAERHRRQVEYDELHGAGIDPRGGRITLTEWWERWRPSTTNLRASTRARHESFWRARIEPDLGALRLDELDRPALRAWVAHLEADGLAPATIHKGVQIVAKMLAAAVDDGRLARNSATGLTLPRADREEMRFLAPPEVDELAATIAPRHRALVYLGAYGGLRLGELLALRRDRVDLLHARVEVLSTLVEISGALHENPPKTSRGRRSVPLPRVVIGELEQHLALSPGEPRATCSRRRKAARCARPRGVGVCGRRPYGAPGLSPCDRTICATRQSRCGSPPARHRTRSPRGRAMRRSSPCSTGTATFSPGARTE